MTHYELPNMINLTCSAAALSLMRYICRCDVNYYAAMADVQSP